MSPDRTTPYDASAASAEDAETTSKCRRSFVPAGWNPRSQGTQRGISIGDPIMKRSITRRTLMVLAAFSAATASPLAAQTAASDGRVTLDKEAWLQDISQFRREVIERDAAFSEEARSKALRRLDALGSRLPSLSDAEIAVEMARSAALAENAHTRLDPLRNRGVWRRYPIRLWKFSDGWRVIAARPDHAALLGAKVIAVGDVPVNEAEAALTPLFAGNKGWSAYMASYSLTAAEALFATGLAGSDRMVIEVITSTGPRTVSLTAEPSERRGRPEENWWYLAAGDARLSGWVHAAHIAPLVLQNHQLGYAHADCAGSVSYIRLNRTADQPGRPSLQAWGEALLDRLKQAPPDRLIVDLRFNTGGDLSKALPFIAGLIDSDPGRRGALTVLINGQTFSAGITQAAWLRQYSTATFVGEPVGDDMTFWAEGDNVVLARSGLTARYSTGGHHYLATPQPPPSMHERLFFTLQAPDLGPDKIIAWSWDDFAAGRDATLEAVAPGLSCGPLA